MKKQTHQPGESTIRLAVIVTVMLSIFAHGLSALPAIQLYTKRIAGLPVDAPENYTTGQACNRESKT